MKKHLFILTSIILLSASCSNHLRNIKPGEIWPDNNSVHINAHGGGILFYEGKYFWFGEHKVEGEKGNQAWVGVHCYSSKNLISPALLATFAFDLSSGTFHAAERKILSPTAA